MDAYLKLSVEIRGKRHWIELPESGPVDKVVIDGTEVSFDKENLFADGEMMILVNNRPYRTGVRQSGEELKVMVDGTDYTTVVSDERTESINALIGNRASKRKKAGDIRAPMPGLVVKMLVKEGEKVKRGKGLILVEAMKMENEIKAPVDGVVDKIKVEAGKTVDKNQLLLVIKGDDD